MYYYIPDGNLGRTGFNTFQQNLVALLALHLNLLEERLGVVRGLGPGHESKKHKYQLYVVFTIVLHRDEMFLV